MARSRSLDVTGIVILTAPGTVSDGGSSSDLLWRPRSSVNICIHLSIHLFIYTVYIYAPSVVYFWLMFFVLHTTINKVYLIWSYLILSKLILSYLMQIAMSVFRKTINMMFMITLKVCNSGQILWQIYIYIYIYILVIFVAEGRAENKPTYDRHDTKETTRIYLD